MRTAKTIAKKADQDVTDTITTMLEHDRPGGTITSVARELYDAGEPDDWPIWLDATEEEKRAYAAEVRAILKAYARR